MLPISKMSSAVLAVLLLCGLTLFTDACHAAPAPKAVDIPVIDRMPDMPAYLASHKLPNWHARAVAFSDLVFDLKSGIPYLDPSGYLSIPPYYESTLIGPANDPYAHDGLTAMGSIYGRSLLGMSNAAYLPMLEEYFQQPAPVGNNARIYASNVNTQAHGADKTVGTNVDSFWANLLPTYYAFGVTLLDGHGDAGLLDKMHSTAQRWYDCGKSLNYDYTLIKGYDFINDKAISGAWKEPDAPAGVAWIEYMGYLRFPAEKQFLEGAEANLDSLESYQFNPNYDGPILCMGALTVARLNAEQGKHYDLAKIVNWVFDNSYSNISPKVISPGAYWNNIGVRDGSYGQYPVDGLTGGPWDLVVGRSRAFSMESMTPPIGLLPLVRYAPEFATPMGKYLLNLAVNSRLFYTDFVPAADQDQSGAKAGELPEIPFESFDQEWTDDAGVVHHGFARGDPTKFKWALSDRSIYGGQAVAILGSTISATNDPRIPKWDVGKLDLAGTCPYPTYLYYNPYGAAKKITLDCPGIASDLYELSTHQYLRHNVRGVAQFTLPPKQGRVVCVVPHGGKVTTHGHRLVVNGHIIDY